MKMNSAMRYLVAVGSYTSESSEGIHLFFLDVENGEMEKLQGVSGVENPSFLAVDPSFSYLYAVSERKDAEGSVVSFSIDRINWKLSKVNEQPSFGRVTCHVVVDGTGKMLVATSYMNAVSFYPVAENGKILPASDIHRHRGSSGVHLDRQEAPHPHSAVVDPTNRFVMVPDLGMDKIVIYRIDAEGKHLIPYGETAVQPGSGPRHFVFHPEGRFAYVINELNSTITGFSYDDKAGMLRAIQTISTLPPEFSGVNYCADIHLSPSGDFLYGSNRGHDSIAVYRVDRSSGRLSWLECVSTNGKNPRNFAITPDGSLLLVANQDSDSIVLFRIHPEKGTIVPIGKQTKVTKPVCICLIALS